MFPRVAPLSILTLCLLLGACAGTVTHDEQLSRAPEEALFQPASPADALDLDLAGESLTDETAEPLALDAHEYQLPTLADTLLQRGLALLGTPYRAGGGSERTGFDCSGFVSYLFREEAGIVLPRSTREMIRMAAPVVSRDQLQPGDVLFFNDRGRGRVSHAGIYIGNGEFIHSSSRRSGGVRVDSLDDRYWNASYLQAKRILQDSAGA